MVSVETGDNGILAANNKSYTAKSYMKIKYEQYRKELKTHVNKIMPLYLYSFRVYLAHMNDRKIINLNLLTQDEIDVMNQ